MAIVFTIPGRLAGKGRPRFVRATGRTYTPAKTESMEAMIRQLGAQAMHGAPPFDEPVSLTLRLILIPPESWSQKRRANTLFAVGRPDLDNVVKLVGDALNGIMWTDDAKIAALNVSRFYRLEGPECARIAVEPLKSLEGYIEAPATLPLPLLLGLEAA